MSKSIELNRLPAETKDLSEQALGYIDSHYGASPDEAVANLTYHNGLHTRQVIIDFLAIADALGLDPASKAIGVAAASSHDLIQGTGRKNDELASAEWFTQKILENGNFSPFQAEMGRLAIVGTEPIFEGGMLVSQVTNQLDYPTKLHEKVARLLASADLGRLYTPDGPYMSHLLFKEINGGNTPEDLSTILPFQRGQVPFLEQYQHPSEEAGHLLSGHKARVLEYDNRLILDIENGRVETWQQLIDQDKEFGLRY